MKNSLIVLMILCIGQLDGQILVTPLQTSIQSISDLYQLEVGNPSGNSYQIKLFIELRNQSRLVYQAETNSYALIQPMVVLNEAMLQPIQVRHNEVDLLDDDYILEVRAVDQTSGQNLFTDRFPVKGTVTARKGRSTSKKLPFDFGGTGRVFGQFSDRKGEGSELPQNFVRAEINPTLSLYSIPIGLDLLLSTEQNAQKQSINQMALRFDAQNFQRLLEEKASQNAQKLALLGNPEEHAKLEGIKSKLVRDKFPKMEQWQSMTQDPKFQAAMDASLQLESLENILDHPEVAQAHRRSEELKALPILNKSQETELKQLEAMDKEIDLIRSKAEKLRPIAAGADRYKKISDKMNFAKRYAKKDYLKDPEFARQSLKEFNLLNKGQRILSGFKGITLGTAYPFFSRLSLSSIPVTGLNVEWNPGKLYVALSYGRSARQTVNTTFAVPQLTLPQTSLAAKIGYGSLQGTHVHLTFMDVHDHFDELSLNSLTKAAKNRVVGASGQLAFLQNRINIGGEWMASLLTRDKTIDTKETTEFKRSDIPLSGIMGPSNASSSFDVAWRLYTDIRVLGNQTRIKGNIERIGANYFSLGAPALLNDILRWKAELSQSLFKNQIRLSAYARRDANNLDTLLTTSRSSTQAFGLSGSLNFRKWPTINLSYAPYVQNNEIVSTASNLTSIANMSNFSLSYPFSFSKDINVYTQIAYMSQQLSSDIGGVDYNMQMYSLNQTLSIKRTAIQYSLNYTPNQIIDATNREILTVQFSGTTYLLKNWSSTMVLQYLSASGLDKKTGFSYITSYPITSFADLELRILKNIYRSNADIHNFDEWVGWTTLRLKW